MDANRIVIADIVRARGVRGEVVARSQTDVPDRFRNLQKAQIRSKEGSDFAVELENAWEHKGDWILKFRGIDSMEAAEQLRGAELWVPVEERGQLTEGEYFQSDLIGFHIIDKNTGENLGVVEGWQQYGGPPLLQIKREQGQALIPFVSAICQDIDLPARLVRVVLPEGLLDL